MKALVLGCGEMGEVAIRDLRRHGGLDAIRVATRSPERARGLLGDLAALPSSTTVLTHSLSGFFYALFDRRHLAQLLGWVEVPWST